MRRVSPCAAAVACILLMSGAPPAPSASLWAGAVDAQVLRAPLPQHHGNVDDLKPGALLVASRSLGDPNFVRTVILLVHHGEDGTMGLVLNRQTDIPIGRVFESIDAARDHTAPVFIGGPVARTGAQVLVRSSPAIADGRRVVGDVHVLGSAEALTRRLTGALDADRFRLYLGYAGWGPGQLEGEVDDDAWHIFEANAAIVFDPDPGTLWLRQIRRTNVQMASAPLPVFVPPDHSTAARQLGKRVIGAGRGARSAARAYSARSASTGWIRVTRLAGM